MAEQLIEIMAWSCSRRVVENERNRMSGYTFGKLDDRRMYLGVVYDLRFGRVAVVVLLVERMPKDGRNRNP